MTPLRFDPYIELKRMVEAKPGILQDLRMAKSTTPPSIAVILCCEMWLRRYDELTARMAKIDAKRRGEAHPTPDHHPN